MSAAFTTKDYTLQNICQVFFTFKSKKYKYKCLFLCNKTYAIDITTFSNSEVLCQEYLGVKKYLSDLNGRICRSFVSGFILFISNYKCSIKLKIQFKSETMRITIMVGYLMALLATIIFK